MGLHSVYPDEWEKKILWTAPANRADLVSPQQVKRFECLGCKLSVLKLKLSKHNLSRVATQIPLNSENKSRGLYFSKPFLKGFIFGGAGIRRGLWTEGNLRFKIDWVSLVLGKKFTVFCFTLYLRTIFKYIPPGGFIFALRVWRAYIWRGLLLVFTWRH